VQQLPDDCVEAMVSQGCCLFKEEKFNEAKEKFNEALNVSGYSCDIAYNISLCYYKMK